MADLLVNGVRLHVQRLSPHGRAPAASVVFLHGLVIDNLSSFYYTMAGPVAEAGFEAIMYDLRGHGRSERPPTGYRLEDSLADLEGLLDAMGLEQDVYLVGNSYGGWLAAQMAITRPGRISGLFLIEGIAGQDPIWIEDLANSLTVAALGLEQGRLRSRSWESLTPSDSGTRAGRRKLSLLAQNVDAILNTTTIIEDISRTRPMDPQELKAIECPVLAFYGANTKLTQAVDNLRKYVPNCEIVLLDGLEHTVLRDAIPSLCEAVRRWLPKDSEGG